MKSFFIFYVKFEAGKFVCWKTTDYCQSSHSKNVVIISWSRITGSMCKHGNQKNKDTYCYGSPIRICFKLILLCLLFTTETHRKQTQKKKFSFQRHKKLLTNSKLEKTRKALIQLTLFSPNHHVLCYSIAHTRSQVRVETFLKKKRHTNALNF